MYLKSIQIIRLWSRTMKPINCSNILTFYKTLGKLSKTIWRIFSVKGVPPPPLTPLTENHFAKNPLAEGGSPPPLNGKSPKIVLKKWVKKG